MIGVVFVPYRKILGKESKDDMSWKYVKGKKFVPTCASLSEQDIRQIAKTAKELGLTEVEIDTSNHLGAVDTALKKYFKDIYRIYGVMVREDKGD